MPTSSYLRQLPFHPMREHEQVHSFSGSDVMAFAEFGNGKAIYIGGLSVFSYSIHREKEPVRRLGRVKAQGYTAGPRTIAGSMVLVTFEQSALDILLQEGQYVIPDRDKVASRSKADEIVPFNLFLTARNEFGDVSSLQLYEVEIMSEGLTTGVDEVYIETVMQYVATDISVLASEGSQTQQALEFEQQIQRSMEEDWFQRHADPDFNYRQEYRELTVPPIINQSPLTETNTESTE